MIQYLLQALQNTWSVFQYVCVVYCIGLAIEFFLPAEKKQPLERIGFNVAYTALFLLLTNLLVPPLQNLIKPVTEHFGLAIPFSFPDTTLGRLLQVLAFFFVIDFLYYWFHRSQHRFNLLWAQHRVHHSEYSLNVTTGNRHHWIEEPLRVFAVWLPFGLVFQQPAMAGWLWSAFLLWGYFIHMNLRISFGPFTPFFCGPQLHRIHHSMQPEHLDRNFAAFFPLFDVLFGTYCKPKPGEYPGTGLVDGEDLNGLVRASISPILYLRRPQLSDHPSTN